MMIFCVSGAGKTYTMLGTSSDPGIMVLTLNDLFKQMKANEEDVIYDVSMCYMEVSARSRPTSSCKNLAH